MFVGKFFGGVSSLLFDGQDNNNIISFDAVLMVNKVLELSWKLKLSEK